MKNLASMIGAAFILVILLSVLLTPAMAQEQTFFYSCTVKGEPLTVVTFSWSIPSGSLHTTKINSDGALETVWADPIVVFGSDAEYKKLLLDPPHPLQHYANDGGHDDLQIVGRPGMARLTYSIRNHSSNRLTESGTCNRNRQPGQGDHSLTTGQPIMDLQPIPKPAKNAHSTNNEGRLDIPAISREANGSIVSIVMLDKDGHPLAQGSGFLISKDGQVVTNYHVIRNGTSAVIKFPDGVFVAADGVLVSDENRDVAVIKVHGNGFKALTLGDSDRLQVGEEVVAIGNPLSLESTVSNGIVSAIRTVEDEGGKFLQITAPISPGSSGGPLFNMAGRVVGITTSHIKGGENLNFAIPINDVKPMLQVRLPSGYQDAKPIARAFPDEPEPETVTPEQSTGPSLVDTLQWMVDSSTECIEDHAPTFHSCMYIFPKDPHAKAFSCQGFSIFINLYNYRDGGTTKSADLLFSFDLGDIDPESVSQEGGMVSFRVTDGQKRIRLTRYIAVDEDHLKQHQLVSNDDLAEAKASFLAHDEDYRSRLTKAFKRAVILCGGKPSKF
jgi:hypothetical protein